MNKHAYVWQNVLFWTFFSIFQLNLAETFAQPHLEQIFQFESVTLDEKGSIVERKQGENTQIVEDLGQGVTLEMVSIPGGTFWMGAPENEEDRMSIETRHQVTVSAFYMSKYEITQAQWEAVVALPRAKRALDADPSSFKAPNRPIENVSWLDVEEFCLRLSQQTGRTYRLPTEAEWEYACRAGTDTPFHFGITITTDIANYAGGYVYKAEPKGEYRRETTPVGMFKVANAFGLYDMHGNMWEWTQDWYGAYPNGAVTNPQGPAAAKFRVLRGGGWCNFSMYARCATRNVFTPDYRSGCVGFRVMMSLSD